MSKKTKETKNEVLTEVTVNGENYDYTVRLFPDNAKTFGKVESTPCSITIDNLITIKGCHFKQSEKNAWLEFPQYKSGEEYKSFIYYTEEMNKDVKAIADAIKDLLG